MARIIEQSRPRCPHFDAWILVQSQKSHHNTLTAPGSGAEQRRHASTPSSKRLAPILVPPFLGCLLATPTPNSARLRAGSPWIGRQRIQRRQQDQSNEKE